MTYATHIRDSHRVARLRPAVPDEHPALPIAPAPLHERSHTPSGPAPGSVVRFETRYWGTVPVTKVFCDQGFKKAFLAHCQAHHLSAEVVSRIASHAFEVLPPAHLVLVDEPPASRSRL